MSAIQSRTAEIQCPTACRINRQARTIHARARDFRVCAGDGRAPTGIACCDDACGEDAALRATVERMLRADESPHALLDGGPVLTSDRWAAGDAFLHFRIGELIGRGGMGEVYQARDLSLNRDVALKVLPADAANTPGDDDRMARLREEAHTLAALNHPNIATIHGLVEADGIRALVLELVEGQTLAEQLAEGTDGDRRRDRLRQADRGRARSRARAGHHPSRSQAVQRQAAARWHSEAAGLRAGEDRATGFQRRRCGERSTNACRSIHLARSSVPPHT